GATALRSRSTGRATDPAAARERPRLEIRLEMQVVPGRPDIARQTKPRRSLRRAHRTSGEDVPRLLPVERATRNRRRSVSRARPERSEGRRGVASSPFSAREAKADVVSPRPHSPRAKRAAERSARGAGDPGGPPPTAGGDGGGAVC